MPSAVGAERHAKVADLGEHDTHRPAACAPPRDDGAAATGTSCPRRSVRSASQSMATASSSKFASTRAPRGRARCAACKHAATQLAEYFAGRRREFDLQLAPVGTDFQLRVARARRDSVRRRAQLRRHRARHRPTEGHTRCGTSERPQSVADRHSLSPSAGQRRHDRRVFRRASTSSIDCSRSKASSSICRRWHTTSVATVAAESLAKLSLPLARADECPKCRVHLHVCRMCEALRAAQAEGCSEDDAIEVRDKKAANFCDYFKPSSARVRSGRATGRECGALHARLAVQVTAGPRRPTYLARGRMISFCSYCSIA